MKASCFLVVLLLAVATGSRLSLAARETSGGGGGGSSSSLGRELGEFFAKAGNFLTSAGRAGADGWHSAATEVDASAMSLMRHGHGGGKKKGPQKRLKKASVNCIPADMCRRKKVLCGKRCYRTSHAGAGAGVSHIPSNRCVVRCKKCVPTC
uniref:Uncharacterized protein n=1 Tax=Avena sativa TaxID=4498 RepID=A0ACD5URT4_AVESA